MEGGSERVGREGERDGTKESLAPVGLNPHGFPINPQYARDRDRDLHHDPCHHCHRDDGDRDRERDQEPLNSAVPVT